MLLLEAVNYIATHVYSLKGQRPRLSIEGALLDQAQNNWNEALTFLSPKKVDAAFPYLRSINPT